MPVTSAPSESLELPKLRQELRIERGAANAGGAASWVIVDPIQHRYVQIDDASYQLLSLWQPGLSFDGLAARARQEFGLHVSDTSVGQFVKFLRDNHFAVEPEMEGWRSYAALAKRAEHGWLMWLIHNYLYIKIPLFRPEPFLKATAQFTGFFYTKAFWLTVAFCGAAGLFLVSREWAAFTSTFQNFFSWQGLAAYGVALIAVKSLHELGHAYTAARFGCRVPSMGVCFLVMFPVLYTDVTDAWRLPDRRQRLMIGAAGIAVEIALACFATLAWAFLPEGIAKSLAFSIATVGWVLSLAVNLNPLMRFDGYYLFADMIGVENLQSRAFDFGKWRLRELLFDLKAPPPEQVPPVTAYVLTLYAWAIWVYRFVVFTGIALVVYHMAFKALGIILFLIEILYFVVNPFAHEIIHWWQARSQILRSRRGRLTLAFSVFAAVLCCIPVSTRIHIPAVLEAAEITRMFPERSGTILSINKSVGDRVSAGDPIAVLSSPELDYQLDITMKKMALAKTRLDRRLADPEDRADSLVIEKEIVALRSQIAGLKKERARLTLSAPVPGIVAEINTAIHPGRAVGRSEFIALIKGEGRLVARGYVAERDVNRLASGTGGVFVADTSGVPAVKVHLREIAETGTQSIDVPELGSQSGGPIAVRVKGGDGNRRRLVPVEARYLALLDAEDVQNVPNVSIRGTVAVRGEGRSLIGRVWTQVAAVLIRESGF